MVLSGHVQPFGILRSMRNGSDDKTERGWDQVRRSAKNSKYKWYCGNSKVSRIYSINLYMCLLIHTFVHLDMLNINLK